MTKQGFLLPVTDTAIEGWRKVDGAKQTIWLGILPLMFLIFVHTTAFSMLSDHGVWQLVVCLPLVFLMSLVGAGLIHAGICVSKNQRINFDTLLYAFKPRVILHMFGLFILQTIIVCIPVALIGIGLYMMTMPYSFIQIAGIVFTMASTLLSIIVIIRIIFSVAVVLDHDEKPFTAIRKSILMTESNFWRILGFLYMAFAIFIASVITVIGLIWTLPFWYIWYGTSYLSLSKNNLPQN